MKKQLKQWLAVAMTAAMTMNCIPAAYAVTADREQRITMSGTTATISDAIVGSEDENDSEDLAFYDEELIGDATLSNVRSGNIQVTTYRELQAALASASDGTSIEIMNDLAPDDGSLPTLGDPVDAVTGATLVSMAENVTVIGNDYTIEGKGYPSFDADGGSLTVENLTIDGAGYTAKLGGAVFVEAGASLTFLQVRMLNCVAGSTADYGGGGAVYVNHHGGGVPTFRAVDCQFIGNSTPNGRGGAIYGSNGNVILENCIFAGNFAANGGAVAMDGSCSLSMTDCEVTDNHADISAGGIYIYHGESTGKRNGTITSRVSAVIDASNRVAGNVADVAGDDIVYSRFYGSSYAGSRTELTLTAPVYDEFLYTDAGRTEVASAGALIQVYRYGDLKDALAAASNGTTIEIMADLSPRDGSLTLGSTVDAVTGATLAVTGREITVIGNGKTITGHGYPTFDADGGELTVEDLTIDGAGYWAKLGGAVFVEYGGELTMKNVTMQNCIAGSTAEYGGGGAVYVNNHGGAAPTFTAIDCYFINNSTLGGRGGAIYGSNGNVVLENCIFEENRAANGGAIAMDNVGELTMTGCQVSTNHALTGGGGVYIYHGNSTAKRNGMITSRVIAVIDESNRIENNTADLTGDDILYGRFYAESYSGSKTETTLTALQFDDIRFSSVERNQLFGSFYGEQVNGSWYLRCDRSDDMAAILAGIQMVTVDGKTFTAAEVFDASGMVRFGEPAVFAGGAADCYSITVESSMAEGSFVAGNVSLDRWYHEDGWISFTTYIDSTDARLVYLWEQAAAKYGQTSDQFKAMWRSMCDTKNGIVSMKVTDQYITAYTADNTIVFRNEYECTYKTMNGLEGDVTYGFTAKGSIADEQFRYLVLMAPGYDGDGDIAAHYHFRYGSDGFEELFATANSLWYPTMCDAGATLDQQCNVLKEMFKVTEQAADTNSSGSDSSGGSSRETTLPLTASGSWQASERGWWFRYTDGTWPSNCWVYIAYNNIPAWYHFDTEGYMQSGWFTDTDGLRYYLNPVSDGTMGMMKTGWMQIGGLWYYFNDSAAGKKGALLTSATTPDGYEVNAEGVWNLH